MNGANLPAAVPFSQQNLNRHLLFEAETGSAFMIGFVNNETSGFPNVTYHSVLLHREDGVLRCTADFIRDTSIKDGSYKLYIYLLLLWSAH